MDNMWYREVETKVLTILKYKLEKRLKSKYPSLNVSNQEEVNGYPKFPTVFIQMTSSDEEGADLEGDSINAINAVFYITVSTNTNKSDTNIVIDNCVDIMKSLRFSINKIPEPKKSGDIYYSTMRCKRIVGANDKL